MIAKLKFMKTNSEYSEKAELWESSQNSSSTGAPHDATKEEKTEQEYLAAENRMLEAREKLILNYRKLTGLGDHCRKAESSNTRLPKLPKFNEGGIKSETNLLDIVE
jgi:hypothetical protein